MRCAAAADDLLNTGRLFATCATLPVEIRFHRFLTPGNRSAGRQLDVLTRPTTAFLRSAGTSIRCTAEHLLPCGRGRLGEQPLQRPNFTTAGHVGDNDFGLAATIAPPAAG